VAPIIQTLEPNPFRFEARRELNGVPAVTIRDLLEATLCHRPDRVILGEIRGGEGFDLHQLRNTGHSGTPSTVHANSAAEGISRFTTCVLQIGVEMPYLAIKSNIAESLIVIVQLERRLIGPLLGSAGPSALIVKATTRGSHQSELSRILRPPMK
jgi:pilus assembly protein CpaF